jgi:3-oxoacyl-[acyl-carrier protein] reductase
VDLGLKGKRALVLGSSGGLGFAIAKCLHDEGAEVVLGSRNLEKLKAAAGRLGGKVEVEALDLSKPGDLTCAVEGILKRGAIDILVNNTGGPTAGEPLKISLEDWDRGYYSLIRSVILLCQLVVPEMEKRQWGRILTVTSTSAREIIPKLPISSTFRAGLTGFTKELAKSVGRSGILVNNLLPGPTATARLDELKVKSPEFYQSMSARSALGRIGQPEEIGRVAAFLCSSANTFITGTDVLADGGFTSAL